MRDARRIRLLATLLFAGFLSGAAPVLAQGNSGTNQAKQQPANAPPATPPDTAAGTPAATPPKVDAGAATMALPKARPGDEALIQHLVMFDKFGRAMDPTGVCGSPRATYISPQGSFQICDTNFFSARPERELLGDFDPYMKALFDALKRSPEANTVDANKPHSHTARKVLIFIHGGLNTDKDTLQRVRKRSGELLAAGYYPIFIGWKSSLVSSWFDSVLNVRYGRWYGTPGWFLAPFYLLGDALRSIGRAPVVWTEQLTHAKDNAIALFAAQKVKANQEYCALRGDYERDGTKALAISKGTNTLPWFPDGTISGAKFAITAAVKFVMSPLLDGVGSAAWSMMERRAHLLFYDDPDDTADKVTTAPPEGNGGLAIFMRTLQEEIAVSRRACDSQAGAACVDWDITLVAHSAGAIVANDILRLFPDVEFSQVVYLAGACSVGEYERAVWPYLAKHRQTHFRHAILHDVAELKESHLHEIPPRGSLLVWIDDLFARPVVPRDQTVGRFVNLMGTLRNTPAGIRDQVSVRVFGLGNETCPGNRPCPQQHDQFTNQNFWLPELWTPKPPGAADVDRALCERVRSATSASAMRAEPAVSHSVPGAAGQR